MGAKWRGYLSRKKNGSEWMPRQREMAIGKGATWPYRVPVGSFSRGFMRRCFYQAPFGFLISILLLSFLFLRSEVVHITCIKVLL